MSKRANHEGQWKQLPSGKWRLVVMLDGHRVYGPAADSKMEARAKLKEKLEAENQPKAKADPQFGIYFYDQLPRLKKQLAETTYALYETVYENKVRKHPLALVPLSQLRADDIQKWMNGVPGQPRTVWRYLQCIKAILEYATSTHLIERNPASPIKPPKVEEHEKEVLTRAAVDRLLKLAWPDRMRAGVLLCLHGLRRAEACGLKYEDFDGDGITVKRQALEVNGKQITRDATKTGGARWVPVNGELKAILKEGKGYVLATRDGKPLRPRNMARSWTNAVEKTEFEKLTLHDLRSTFGMLLLEKGVDVRTASEMMGHSPAMLARIYARSRKDLKQEALAKVFA